MGSLSHFLCKTPLPPPLSSEDAHIFDQDPVEFPPQWIFIVDGCQLRSLQNLFRTCLPCFCFERTADVQIFNFVFACVGRSVWGRSGPEALERNIREERGVESLKAEEMLS